MVLSLTKILAFILIILISSVYSFDTSLLDNTNPLILMTQQNHLSITKINDLKNIEGFKSLLVEPEDFEKFIGQLSDYIKKKNVDKKLLSSIYTKIS